MFEGRSTAEVLAILAGLGVLFAAASTALATVIIAIFKGLSDIRSIKTETLAQTAKIDIVAKETAVVLGHVNSEKTKDTAKIEYQALENKLLREQLVDKDRVAGLLAQSAVQAARTVAPSSGSIDGPSAATALAHMETHTKETAENTKETAENTKTT